MVIPPTHVPLKKKGVVKKTNVAKQIPKIFNFFTSHSFGKEFLTNSKLAQKPHSANS
jgi:hypothetical protein